MIWSGIAELHNTLTLQEQGKLIELRQDGGLRSQFFDFPLDRFWVITSNKFTNLANRALPNFIFNNLSL